MYTVYLYEQSFMTSWLTSSRSTIVESSSLLLWSMYLSAIDPLSPCSLWPIVSPPVRLSLWNYGKIVHSSSYMYNCTDKWVHVFQLTNNSSQPPPPPPPLRFKQTLEWFYSHCLVTTLYWHTSASFIQTSWQSLIYIHVHTFSSCCFSLLFSASLCSNCEASFTVAWFRAFSFSWASLRERGLPGAGGAAWSASNWLNLETTMEANHCHKLILPYV